VFADVRNLSLLVNCVLGLVFLASYTRWAARWWRYPEGLALGLLCAAIGLGNVSVLVRSTVDPSGDASLVAETAAFTVATACLAWSALLMWRDVGPRKARSARIRYLSGRLLDMSKRCGMTPDEMIRAVEACVREHQERERRNPPVP
jgi:hypothetical protein